MMIVHLFEIQEATDFLGESARELISAQITTSNKSKHLFEEFGESEIVELLEVWKSRGQNSDED